MARFIPITRRQYDTADNPFWISYADLMTALVMLFLVVMSISMITIAIQAVKEKQMQETAKIEREKEVQEVIRQLAQHAAAAGVDLTVNRMNHTISFGEKARFAHDSYQLSPEAKQALQQFVPILLKVHAEQPGGKWLKRGHIEGYTDETGTYLYNVDLSLKRAQAVVCTMYEGGLSPEQQRDLRQLLMIDGATVTSIKPSREESRRVEVRLEFRQVDDTDPGLPAPEMPIGTCMIDLQSPPAKAQPATRTTTGKASPLGKSFSKTARPVAESPP